ncbi:MAG: hypothetical protein MZV63_24685 [Marinilabiliales bacterium]|nr:hypothetical protein [Marinilabiliales bacterium]
MLIAGLEGHICDHCIEQAHSIMNEELGSKEKFQLRYHQSSQTC